MSAPWQAAEPSRGTASTPVFLTTFGMILAAIAGFLVLDLWLARIQTRESTLHAAHLFEDGQALLAQGRARDAVDLLASAQALERTNVRYGVALAEAMLAEAMLADGRPAEAEVELRQALSHSETDGRANLVMARILVREGHADRAASFYQRAIYGSWAGDVETHRLAARLELIDLLARRGAQSELLAELLPLQDIPPDSVPLRRRIGHLFLQAGSPERAIPIFRDLLHRDANDGDAYAAMGEAALELGNFHTARADLVLASRLLSGDARLRARLDVVDSVLAMDPEERGIGAAARVERSRALLRRTLDATAGCARSDTDPPLVDSARQVLATPKPPAGEAGERESDAMLDLAGDLWSSRGAACRIAGGPAAEALGLVHDKLRR